MKKLLVSLLAIVGMVACTNDEVVSVQQGNPIAFDTFVENTTRVGYDSTNLPEGFNVWAFIETENGNRSTILEAEDVTRQGDQYVYGNTQYWVPGNTYYFAALAPKDSQNVTNLQLATGDAAKKGLGTFDFNNDNGTEDLIYAVNMVEASETTSKVTFTFKHLLSKVKFSFTNTFDNANYSIEVRDIAMTVPMSGTVNLAADEVEWTPGTTSLGLNFDKTGIIAQSGVANSAERLTIPAGVGQVYGVTFKVDLYVGNGANKVLAKTYEKGSTISGIEFEAGKAYNFAAAINAESLALNEVIFDASVDGWDSTTTVQLIDTPEKFVDAIEDPEVDRIILDGDINLDDLFGASTLSTRAGANSGLVIDADRTLTLDLNGHKISHEKECTASYEMIKNLGNLTITGNGTISFKDTGAGDPTYGWGSYTIRNEGTLTVENGTIEHLGEQDAHMICAIFQYSGHSTINGGKISTPNYRSARLWSGDMTINGGEFEGQLWLQAVNDTSDLTINGGTFAPRGGDSSSVFVSSSGYSVKFAVTGGHFTTKIGMSEPFGCITGGTFTTAAKEGTNVNLLAKGYVFMEGENGDYTVVNTGHYTDENGNYYISNANGLAWVSENVNTMEFYVNKSANIFDGKTVYLTNDIDLGGAEWRPIGDYAFSRTSFNGIFDGQGYTVSNFKVTDRVQWTEKVTEASYGFFGNVKGTIKNLTIKNATVNPEGGRYSAALVGRLHNGGVIENCHVVNSTVTISHWQVGGLVGQNNNGNISNCSVDESTITGMAAVGAIVGLDMANGEHTIENCRVANSALVQNGSFGASYDASYGLAVGLVNASGIVLNIDNVVAENNTIKGVADNTLVGDIETGAKVTINGVSIATTAEQLKAALTNDNTVIIGANIENATIKLPATLNNFTLRAAEGVSLKNTTISAADGNAYHYENLTFDGITFDNSRILLTGWRNGEEVIENLTVTNCVFMNLDDSTSEAAVHINKDASEAVKNFTFTNNVINDATGGSKSGVYAQVTGDVVFENNIINNVAFRPYVIQITTNDNIDDTFTVRGNTFSGSPSGRAQCLGNNAEGTDSVELVVSGNIFKDITEAQQICYWNFNAATTTADLSKNYYSIDIEANPSRIYYNAAASSVDDLKAMGVYPFYTALNADGTINLNSLKQAE